MPRQPLTTYNPNAGSRVGGGPYLDYPLNLSQVRKFARHFENGDVSVPHRGYPTGPSGIRDDDSWGVLALHDDKTCPPGYRWAGPTLVVRNLRTGAIFYLPGSNCTDGSKFPRFDFGEYPIPATPFKLHDYAETTPDHL